MSPNILGNALKHSGGMSSNIPGNVAKHSGECSQTIQRIFKNNLGHVVKHPVESMKALGLLLLLFLYFQLTTYNVVYIYIQ